MSSNHRIACGEASTTTNDNVTTTEEQIQPPETYCSLRLASQIQVVQSIGGFSGACLLYHNLDEEMVWLIIKHIFF